MSNTGRIFSLRKDACLAFFCLEFVLTVSRWAYCSCACLRPPEGGARRNVGCRAAYGLGVEAVLVGGMTCLAQMYWQASCIFVLAFFFLGAHLLLFLLRCFVTAFVCFFSPAPSLLFCGCILNILCIPSGSWLRCCEVFTAVSNVLFCSYLMLFYIKLWEIRQL